MVSLRLHDQIELAYGLNRPIFTREDYEALWAITRKWIMNRANELCPKDRLGNGIPTKTALRRACWESGWSFTDQEINRMWETNQRELDDPQKCPIVVTSQQELDDEIEKARARGDLFQSVRW